MISINYFLDDCDHCCKCRCWCLECLFSAGFSLVSAVRGGGCAGASSPRGFQCPGTGQCWGPGPWTQPGCYPGHINLPSIYSVRPASQGHGLLTPWQLHRGKLIPDTETRSDPQFHDLTIAIVDCGSLCYLFASIILRFVLVLLIVSE